VPSPLTVLVDARNVLRSTWPNLSEEQVVQGSCAWAREHDARAVVVFDGEAPGGIVGEREVEGCVVVGTGARESADDWLWRAAGHLRRRNEQFWLVTSDRELRAHAGEGAERIIGGGRFARELQQRV
jgi:predicted RNA-binding protein with PIN domain